MRDTMIWTLLSVLLAWPAWAQVSIDRVPAIAQAIHNAERMNFGASSSRDGRNRDWARIVGIIHFGHPVYNPTPDPSWCIKDGGGGRPQSDDVIVQCQSRVFYDCIPGSGADGYRFQCSADGVLPSVQNVYRPPVPSGGGGTPVPPTTSRWTVAHTEVIARLGRPASGLSDPAFVQRVAEQFGHSFPSETWGMKRVSAGRPLSGDVLARQVDGLILGYRIIPATTAPVELDITGQAFEPVSPRDHLQSAPPPPPPPSGLQAVIDAVRAVEARLDALAATVESQGGRLEVIESRPLPIVPAPVAFPCSTGNVFGRRIRVCPEAQ